MEMFDDTHKRDRSIFNIKDLTNFDKGPIGETTYVRTKLNFFKIQLLDSIVMGISLRMYLK